MIGRLIALRYDMLTGPEYEQLGESLEIYF